MKKLLILFSIISLFILSCNDKNEEPEETSNLYEKELTFDIDSVTIYGTLLMPDSVGEYPLVIIVAGSGPTDRNGNNTFSVKAQSYKLIADTLAANNIASFRYDKRAIAKSKMPNLKEQNLVFETYINDLVEIVKSFQNDKRFSKIIILGHSEGALIGAVASNITNPDAFISVAGTGRSADTILIEQLSTKPEYNLNEAIKIIDEIKKGTIAPVFDQNLAQIFRPSVQPYLKSWFNYIPSTVYSELTIPTLIIHGTTDVQIPETDAEKLHNVCNGSKLVIVEGMNHILKDAPADTTLNLKTYGDANLPLTKQFSVEILDFIKGLQ